MKTTSKVLLSLGIVLLCFSCGTTKNAALEKQALLQNWILQTEAGTDQMGCNVNKPLNISFKEKEVNGYSGCNTFFGPYKLGKKHQIRFGNLASTMMACVGQDCGKIEVGVIRNLAMVNKYKITQDHLYLYQDNELLLTYRKAQ